MSGKSHVSGAAAAKKSEEQRLAKLMRALLCLPHNRNCADCGQLGPTYVNMTIGSFICTQCSGILYVNFVNCIIFLLSLPAF